MHPIIHLGRVSLSSYTLLYAVALLAGGWLAFWRLVRGGLAPGPAGWCVLIIIWAAFLGAMGLMSLFGTLASWITTGTLTWQRGNAYIGALLTALAAAAWVFHHYKLPLGWAFDRIVVAIPLGQAIGRIGCLMAGCCYGQISHSWFALNLPDRHGTWLPRYPARLMATAANLLIMVLLLLAERWSKARRAAGGRGLFEGALLWLYLALYAVKRFGLDFIRADTQRVWGPLSVIQLITAAICVVALSVLIPRLGTGIIQRHKR